MWSAAERLPGGSGRQSLHFFPPPVADVAEQLLTDGQSMSRQLEYPHSVPVVPEPTTRPRDAFAKARHQPRGRKNSERTADLVEQAAAETWECPDDLTTSDEIREADQQQRVLLVDQGTPLHSAVQWMLPAGRVDHSPIQSQTPMVIRTAEGTHPENRSRSSPPPERNVPADNAATDGAVEQSQKTRLLTLWLLTWKRSPVLCCRQQVASTKVSRRRLKRQSTRACRSLQHNRDQTVSLPHKQLNQRGSA